MVPSLLCAVHSSGLTDAASQSLEGPFHNSLRQHLHFLPWVQLHNAAGMCVLPTAHSVRFSSPAQKWVAVLEANDKYWDQNAFNDLFRRGSRPLPDRADNLFL